VFQGVLCMEAPTGRYSSEAAQAGGNPGINSIGQFDTVDGGVFHNMAGSSASGTGFDVPAQIPNPPGGFIGPGDTWCFQLWFRDESASGAPSANFSDVLCVTF